MLSTTAANQGLNALDASGTPTNLMAYVSLHTASPGSPNTLLNEYAGVTRQACTWNAASSGAKTNSTSMTHTTNGATPVTYESGASASTGGTGGLAFALISAVQAATITTAGGALSAAAA